MSRLPKPTGLPVPRTGIPRPGASQYVRPPGIPGLPGPSASSEPGQAGYQVRPSGSRLAVSGARMVQPRPITQPSAPRTSRLYPTQSGSQMSSRPQSVGAKDIQSKTKVTVTRATGEKKTAVKIDKATIPKSKSTVVPKRSAAVVPIPPPSVLRKQVSLQVKGAAAKASIGSKVTAVAAKKTKVAPLERIATPSGPQQVIQKVIREKRVERSKLGEVVSRNIKTIETDPRTGETTQIEEEVQKLNPDFPAPKGPLKEIITVVSETAVTQSHETRTENIVQETIKLDTEIGVNPQQLSQLIEEEKEDVDTILKLPPPDILNQSTELYPLRKKLHALRLNPENISILEQSVIKPPLTADEPLSEPSPELMATVMDTTDRGGMPEATPEQIFNSLFSNAPKDDPVMIVSSATPGPLGDIVVPTLVPEVIHEAMLSKQMEEVAAMVQTAEERPTHNSFVEAQPSQPRKRARRKRPYKPLTEEDPPWTHEDLDVACEAVGARLSRVTDPADVLELTQTGNLSKEMAKGIEYILDADPIQYYSRVQLRGSQPPPWFPGYLVALSGMPDTVEIAKSPSQVLFSAWRSVQPDIFPDDSIVYN